MLHTEDVLIPFSSSYSSMLWAHKWSVRFHSNRLLAMRDGSMSKRGEFKVMQKISERTQGQRYFAQRGREGALGWIASFLVPLKHWLGLMLLVMFHCSPIYASLRCPLQRDACSFGQMHGPELPTIQLRKMVRKAMKWHGCPLHYMPLRRSLRLRSELGRTLCSPRCTNSVKTG